MPTASPRSLPETVYVTGARGFLGRNLVREFRAQGLRVVSLVRQPNGEDEREFHLETNFDFSAREPGAFIHCAWIMNATNSVANDLNVAGSERVLAAARAHGMDPVIFVSTTSVQEDAVSAYAKAKRRVEEFCHARDIVVVRPGLVISPSNDGGMVEKLSRLVRKLPVIPLVGGGSQAFYVSDTRDFAAALMRMIEDRGLYDPERPVLAHPRSVSLREILRVLAQRLGRRRILFPVPGAPIRLVLWLSHALRIPLPVNQDNLKGLLALPANQPINLNLSRDFRSFDERSLGEG